MANTDHAGEIESISIGQLSGATLKYTKSDGETEVVEFDE